MRGWVMIAADIKAMAFAHLAFPDAFYEAALDMSEKPSTS